ncbi:MAG: AraC family transcriptional regulator ligand-binding domain-containing protein [Xanthomonadales bacterium]|jgi:AraC-like DNA-binding protein|nr:AraC family transcriptional regulator ligand-binding domain-containing protein [Xanthomonadales bacterium]
MPSTYLKLVVQAVETAGHAATSVLDGTRLEADQLQRSEQPVSFEATLQVLRNAERLFGPGWHLGVGQRLTAPAHGPLGFAVVTAPTLKASLDVLLRFMGIRAPFLWSSGARDGDQFVFRFFDAVDMGDQRETLIELAALSLQGLIERPLGREIQGASLSFAYAEPVYGEALAGAFHCTLAFGAEHHALRLPVAWLEQPCALSDEAMHRYLLHRCEEELATSSGGLPTEVTVRRALLATPGLIPGLAEVARTQHISTRTLIRRLKREGTTFQAIRDDVRQTLARDHLVNSDLTIAEIAWRLGYQDPSNFGRAFRRWLGVSPRTFREREAASLDGPG